jgi:hypothetical protein
MAGPMGKALLERINFNPLPNISARAEEVADKKDFS